jgi:hypothetical protein
MPDAADAGSFRRERVQKSLMLRSVYVIALTSVALPSPTSPWAGLALGGGAPAILGAPMLVLAAIVIWRIFTVVRDPSRLDSPPLIGAALVLQRIAILTMGLGAIVALARWFVVPIVHAVFSTTRSDSGVEYFVVGLWLALIVPLASIGVMLFEATRLAAFERLQRKQPRE